MDVLCPHCQIHPLLSEREVYIKCCYVCRRYALLLGRWLDSSEVMKVMISELNDEKVARVFALCERIVAIKMQVPPTPSTFGQKNAVQLETARALRDVLEQNNEVLMELGALLR